MKKLITILLTGISALTFTACGGSGSSDTAESSLPTQRTGGSIDEPVQLIADGRTYITTYNSKSYFTYTAEKDENLIMKVTLERNYTDSEKEEYISSDMTEEEMEFGHILVEVFNEQYEIATDEDVETFGPLQEGSWEDQTYDYTFKKAGTYILNIGVSIIPNARFSAASIE
jgi:hypothetical protein